MSWPVLSVAADGALIAVKMLSPLSALEGVVVLGNSSSLSRDEKLALVKGEEEESDGEEAGIIFFSKSVNNVFVVVGIAKEE